MPVPSIETTKTAAIRQIGVYQLLELVVAYLGMREMGTGSRGGQVARMLGRSAASVAFLIALAASQQVFAQESRTISFHNMHTKEDLTITYKVNGRYVPEALAKINYMLRDWRRNEATKMSPKLIDLIYDVHRDTGSKLPIHVVSGYRSPVTNAALRRRSKGVAKHSQHMLGHATDLYFPDVPLAKIREVGLKYQRGGVGYYPTSGRPFVHLDVGSVRHWPRMSRQELARLFPDGNTLHVPADGKPLPRKVKTAPILVASNDTSEERFDSTKIAAARPFRQKDPSAPVFNTESDEQELTVASVVTPDDERDVILNKPIPAKPQLLADAETDEDIQDAPLPPSRPIVTARLDQNPEALSFDLPRENAPVPTSRPSPQYSLAGLIASLPGRDTSPEETVSAIGYAPVSQAAKKGDSLFARAAASGNPLITASLGPSGIPQPVEFDDESDSEEETVSIDDESARVRSLMNTRRISGSGFAVLKAPDQERIASMVASPALIVTAQFGHGPGQEPMTGLFTGPAVKPLLVTRMGPGRFETASVR